MNLREQLIALHQKHGKLTPRLVVAAARPKNSALHSRFEWDDKVAGEKYRESQAADLIRSVKITYAVDDRQESVRSFVSVQRDGENVYDPLEQVVEDEMLTEVVLRAMELEWRQMKARYGRFREFAEMVRSDIAA